MNFNVVQQLLGRLSERTKMIGIGIIAFLLGMMLAGRGPATENGRYVPWGENGELDTRSGKIWVIDRDTHRVTQLAALPYF